MSQWDQAGEGALGGGMTGATIGTAVMPGWGTLIGGVGGALIGGAAGYFGSQGSQGYEDQLKQLAAGYGTRRAPQVGPASQAGYSDFRQNQAGLVSQLESMARGQGPSAAQGLMREAMDRQAGAQASAAAGAGGRGVNQGAALRQAMNNTAAIQAQNARDTGNMRVNEQLGAINQLSGTLAQGRSADEGVNMFNSGQQNQMSQANLAAQLQTMGLNDKSQLQALLMAIGAAGPGLGTQLLAGGAQSMPSMLQYMHGVNSAGPGGGSGNS